MLNASTRLIVTVASICTVCAILAFKFKTSCSKKVENNVKKTKKKRIMLPLPCGLINVGNSCYLSSVLQLLAAAEEMITDHFSKCGAVGQELLKLIKRINLGGKRDGIRPVEFIKTFTGAMGLLSTEQQDAHEFLLALLNLRVSVENKPRRSLSISMSMDFDENVNKKEHHLQANSPFTGVMMNELICLPCATKRKKRHISSLKIEPFSCVSLSNTNTSLNEEVYRNFCVPERFSDYSNSGCGLGAINQKNPLVFPELLFLHISLLSRSMQKSATSSETVEELSGPGYRYKLLGLIVHLGSTGHAGHFVCYRRLGTDRWIECNDAKVRVVEIEEVLKQTAYILLYQKQE